MGLEFKSHIGTTREQSEKLLALGLDPETADMSLRYSHDNSFVIVEWSLSRLLEMMPKQIQQMNRPNANLDINSDGKYWFVTYEELGYD